MSSIAERMAGMAAGSKRGGIAEHAEKSEASPASEGEHSQLHAHGDGTYHTVTSGGEKTEHPHIGHALMHLANHHEPEGKHTHVHHSEDGMHTSHHHDGSQVSGPHDHENLDALKSHMDQFLNEEKGEWSGEDYGKGKHEGHDGLM